MGSTIPIWREPRVDDRLTKDIKMTCNNFLSYVFGLLYILLAGISGLGGMWLYQKGILGFSEFKQVVALVMYFAYGIIYVLGGIAFIIATITRARDIRYFDFDICTARVEYYIPRPGGSKLDYLLRINIYKNMEPYSAEFNVVKVKRELKYGDKVTLIHFKNSGNEVIILPNIYTEYESY